MSFYFTDSSALVKRYLTETGSDWILQQLDITSGNMIVIAETTPVEVAGALAARHRAQNGISRIDRDKLFQLLNLHWSTEYRTIQMNSEIVDVAMSLTQRHRLRGYDAIQLATALVVQSILPSLVFLSSDNDLNNAARAEGLTADNPTAHRQA